MTNESFAALKISAVEEAESPKAGVTVGLDPPAGEILVSTPYTYRSVFLTVMLELGVVDFIK